MVEECLVINQNIRVCLPPELTGNALQAATVSLPAVIRGINTLSGIQWRSIMEERGGWGGGGSHKVTRSQESPNLKRDEIWRNHLQHYLGGELGGRKE